MLWVLREASPAPCHLPGVDTSAEIMGPATHGGEGDPERRRGLVNRDLGPGAGAHGGGVIAADKPVIQQIGIGK
jgi:hypothetical protein